MNENLDYKFIDNNSDKTIVFLHGWGLNKNSFTKIVSSMSDKFNILCLDFFGFGGSPEPVWVYDTYEYAYDIFMFIQRLNLKKIFLVGHSFGGRIAIILSSIYQLDICGMVLTSSAGLNRFSLLKYLKIKWFKLCKKLSKFGIVNKGKLDRYGSSDYINLSQKMKLVFIKIVNQDLRGLLNKINCNTLLVWDRKDSVTPKWICNKLFRYIKTSHKYYLSFGGHFACFYNVNKFVDIVNKMTSIYI